MIAAKLPLHSFDPFAPLLSRRGKRTVTFALGESTGSSASPIMVFASVKAACKAASQFLKMASVKGLPRGTERMLLLLEVGTPGAGFDSIKTRGADGQMMCTQVTPIKLCPLPAAEVGAVTAREIFWLPG